MDAAGAHGERLQASQSTDVDTIRGGSARDSFVKRRSLLSHLRSHECALFREGAKHSWRGNPATGRRSAVPRHAEIDDLLARKICRDLGVPESLS